MKRILHPMLAALAITAAAFSPATGRAQSPPPAIEAERLARTVIDLMRQGRRLLAQGDPRRAAMEFEKVIQLDPSNSAAAEQLARCMAAVSCGRAR